MVAEEKKTESVATSAPTTASEAAPSKKRRAKSDKLILPVILLVISVGGLVYMYISGTFSSIYSWFTSKLIANYGMLVLAGLLGVIAIIGLIILFKRIGRKFTGND